MIEKILVFIYKKNDNTYHNYQIIKDKKTIKDIDDRIKKANESDENFFYKKITDKDYIKAFFEKYSRDSIKTYCEDILQKFENIAHEISKLRSCFDNFQSSLKESLEDE